tara:strand:- start:858 stop:1385 length:528 start_codon:yes stop_codon:yes gene_type:complete
MFKLHPVKAIGSLLFLTILTACSSTAGTRIGNTVTLCCPGNYANYQSYAIEDAGVPFFMRDYVIMEFDTAFQELGMVRNDGSGDIIVNLNYRHVNLDSEQQDIDPLMRVESMTVELRYIANIDISMRERAGGKIVWEGTISRIHTVQPGEYMHEEGASTAFLATFRDLLSEYPRN